MLIKPTDADFSHWIKCVPIKGDLLFFEENVKTLNLPVPVLTIEYIQAQSLDLWTLNHRSWYGYSLNNAKYGAWFPLGTIESLESDLRSKLAAAQTKLKVPTLIRSALLAQPLRNRPPRSSKHYWVTSAVWKSLARPEKVDCLKAWFLQNEIVNYETQSLESLSRVARFELKRIGLQSVVNQYHHESGANCFGAVAGAISPKWQNKVAQQWLHWKPLESLLEKLEFTRVKSASVQKGDVIVFYRKNVAVHAAYLLDDQVYFEKPGQDFYEPYRLVKSETWKTEWPDSKLVIYRKK